MNWIISNKDLFTTLAAITGVILGLYNLWRGHNDKQINLKVHFVDSIYDGNKEISIVNHGNSAVSIVDAGFITIWKDFDSVLYAGPFEETAPKLPVRLEPLSEVLLQLPFIRRYVGKSEICKVYALTATGKRFVSKDSRSIKIRLRDMFRRRPDNPFNKI